MSINRGNVFILWAYFYLEKSKRKKMASSFLACIYLNISFDDDQIFIATQNYVAFCSHLIHGIAAGWGLLAQ